MSFALTDLGPGFNVEFMPFEGESALLDCTVMEHLFPVLGAPLVFKADVGS